MKKFEGVEIGTKVRDPRFEGVGKIVRINYYGLYPIIAEFQKKRYSYTFDGCRIASDKPILFFDNGYEEPKDAGRPLPDIPENTVVFVWYDGEDPVSGSSPMFFGGFTKEGMVLCKEKKEGMVLEYDHYSLVNPLL